MQTFHGVGGAQRSPKGGGKSKDRETFREVIGHPLRQTRSALLVFHNGSGKVGLGSGTVWCIEDGANVCSDFGLHLLAGHIALRILLEMELAALPGNATEDRDASCPFPSVIVAGNELHATQPALLQALQEAPPVDFMLA